MPYCQQCRLAPSALAAARKGDRIEFRNGALRARLQGQAGHAVLAFRIDPVPVQVGRAAGAQHNVGAANEHPFILLRVQAHHPGHAGFIRRDPASQQMIQDAGPMPPGRLFQRFGHEPAGERPGGRSPQAAVVIGAVAHIFPERVGGKGHAQRRQPQEAGDGGRRFAQGGIAVHVVAHQRPGQRPHAVTLVPGQGQLKIRLLIAAGVAGGARVHVFRDQGAAFLSQHHQPVHGVESGTAGPHHHRSEFHFPHGFPPISRSVLSLFSG